MKGDLRWELAMAGATVVMSSRVSAEDASRSLFSLTTGIIIVHQPTVRW